MIKTAVRMIVNPFFFLLMIVDTFGRGLSVVGLCSIGMLVLLIIPTFIAVKMGQVSLDVIRLLAALGFFGVVTFSVGRALAPPQDSR